MSDSEPIIVSNTDDPRSERMQKDGVDIDSPDFDPEVDAELHPESQPDADTTDDTSTTTDATPPADPAPAPAAKTDSKPKTGSVPVQSADASADTGSAKS